MDEDTYLTTQYKDRDAVKALGARWDPNARRWYVPAGRELAPFAAWLPDAASGQASASSADLTVQGAAAMGGAELAVVRKGITLSQLLAGVSQAVAQAFKGGVWTMVEVVDARLRGGHVYLEVSERTRTGEVAAKASAVIWARFTSVPEGWTRTTPTSSLSLNERPQALVEQLRPRHAWLGQRLCLGEQLIVNRQGDFHGPDSFLVMAEVCIRPAAAARDAWSGP